MKTPVTIEVRPVGEEKKHAQKLMLSGLGFFFIGCLILLFPHSLNLLFAGLLIIVGIIQLLVLKNRGLPWQQSSGWLVVLIGVLLMIFPKLINYVLILMFVGLTILAILFFIQVEAKLWIIVFSITALAGGLLMLFFPLAINQIFAIFIILTGIQQLWVSYQSYYRWKWS